MGIARVTAEIETNDAYLLEAAHGLLTDLAGGDVNTVAADWAVTAREWLESLDPTDVMREATSGTPSMKDGPAALVLGVLRSRLAAMTP